MARDCGCLLQWFDRWNTVQSTAPKVPKRCHGFRTLAIQMSDRSRESRNRRYRIMAGILSPVFAKSSGRISIVCGATSGRAEIEPTVILWSDFQRDPKNLASLVGWGRRGRHLYCHASMRIDSLESSCSRNCQSVRSHQVTKATRRNRAMRRILRLS
jgi:hypothetical protein